jgi:uncharacterized Zn-binding protein involved in type VI secretion
MGGFMLGALVSIRVGNPMEDPLPLFSGTITALEFDYAQESGSRLVVRAIDPSHKLTKNNSPRIFRDMTTADIIQVMAAESGIVESEIIPTSDMNQVLVKPNIDDWSFIQYLARNVGYMAYFSGGVFNFAPPTPAEEGPPIVASYNEPSIARQLVLGRNLIRFNGRVSSTNQAETINVRGWGIYGPVEGEGPVETVSAVNIEPNAEIAATAGVPLHIISGSSIKDEDTAENIALSAGDYIAGQAYQMAGIALGDPTIVAGSVVSLSQIGASFDGQYMVSEATHLLNADVGYHVDFILGGRHSSALTELMGSGADGAYLRRQSGLVTGIVTSLDDPENLGRVKVKFPWLDPMHESDWARVVQMSGSEEAGTILMPNIGSEVLCGFEDGNINFPYVLGTLWNVDVPPVGIDMAIDPVTGVVQRVIGSPNFKVTIDDNPETMGVRINDIEENLLFSLNGTDNMIMIQVLGGEMTISGGVVTIEGTESLEINAPEITINADAALSISAASISIAGDADVTIEGATVSVDAGVISLG